MDARELDRLMAERVMGWSEKTMFGVLSWATEDEMEWIHQSDWSPTTDTRKALIAARKLVDSNDGWEFTIEYDGRVYGVLFWESAEGFIVHGAADNKDPALAVCLAAAEAIGENISSIDT